MKTYTKELKEFVTTVEESKQLLKLELEYETKFVWYYQISINDYSIRLRSEVNKYFDNEIYPAFTSDELWELYKSLDPTINKTKLINDMFYYVIEHTNKSAESGITQ